MLTINLMNVSREEVKKASYKTSTSLESFLNVTQSLVQANLMENSKCGLNGIIWKWFCMISIVSSRPVVCYLYFTCVCSQHF